MADTDSTLLELEYPDEPGRILRLRIEGPSGYAEGAPQPHVLVLHGFKGFMHWGFFPDLSQRLARSGLIAVSFNTSGSGIGPDLQTFSDDEGFARNTFSRELEDIDRVRAHVRSARLPGIDVTRAGILGHSRGGGTAILHAAEHGDYRAVVTWAAIDTVDRFGELTKETWREQGFILIHNGRTGQDHRLDLEILEDAEANQERLDIQSAAGRLTAPTLVIHGDDDESVHVSAAENILARLPEHSRSRMIVDGAGHTFDARHPFEGASGRLERVYGATLEHFNRHLT